MKPTKPFIVEVRGRRKSSNQKEKSIWAGLNLQGLMQAETSDDEPQQLPESSNTTNAPVHLVERSRILETVIETVVEPRSTASTISTDTMVVAKILALGSGPVSAETAEQPTTRYVRRSKRQKEQLPRGEKWKRRLPKCLHCK